MSEPYADPTPHISLVVPTRDRPASLARCLAALSGQRTDADVEVIVVDDSSVDGAAVATAIGGHGTARLLTATGAGPAAARNLGARNARAPIVAFTDDDCAPDPGWVDSLLAAFDRDATVVAGPTVSGRPRDRFAAASQTVTNHLVEAGLDGSTVTFAPTSNLAVRREVHLAVRFDEDFPLAAGEDRDYCDRLRGSGHAITYEPAARVEHFQDLGPRGFWRQQRRYGEGAVHWRDRGDDRGRQPIGFYTELVRKGRAQGPTVGALVVVAQVATLVGMRRARRFQAT